MVSLALTTPVIGPDFAQLRAHLLQVLGAPPSLSLSVAQDSVVIRSDNLPARDYQPGESFVRFDEYGNATVSCGWSGQAFVVRERYLGHAALTERYEVDPKSGTLTYTRELKDPALGNIELKSVSPSRVASVALRAGPLEAATGKPRDKRDQPTATHLSRWALGIGAGQ